MLFRDSRLIISHFGRPDDSTPEQQEALRRDIRSRVKRLAAEIRSLLPQLDRECRNPS